MKQRIFKKCVLSLVLCAIMLLNAMPMTDAAESLGSTGGLTLQGNTAQIPISKEVVAWREENVKHFDMGDGTFQAVVYSHPVHEMDSKGIWQDIDFGLRLDRTRKTAAYTNETSGIAFAANYTENSELMSITDEDNSISVTLLAPQPEEMKGTEKRAATAKVTEAKPVLTTFEEAQNAKFASKVLYENVMPGVDLEYVYDISVVKENIIVKEPMPEYSFTFQMDLEGLYPKASEEGCIFIYDTQTNERKYGIAAPYMYDGMGNICEAVNYSLKQATANKKIGMSYIGYPIIQMLNMLPEEDDYDPVTSDWDYEEAIEACMGITLIHETAHTFGMEEAYDDPGHDQELWHCVMEAYKPGKEENMVEFYESIAGDPQKAFCSSCKSTLRDLINNRKLGN